MTTIKVTQEDIDKGLPGNACMCPVARAIKRLVPNASVRVGVTQWVDTGRNKWRNLPAHATAFIDSFDTAEPVEPFEFELDLS